MSKLTTSSDHLQFDAREVAWAIYFLSKVAPIAKHEQEILLRLIEKFEREHVRFKQA